MNRQRIPLSRSNHIEGTFTQTDKLRSDHRVMSYNYSQVSDQRLMEKAFLEFIARADSDSQVAVVSFGHSTTLTPIIPWTTIARIPDHHDSIKNTRGTNSCIGDALFSSLEVCPL